MLPPARHALACLLVASFASAAPSAHADDPAAPADETPARAVTLLPSERLVYFDVPEDPPARSTWTVRDPARGALCTLPCWQVVSPSTGLFVAGVATWRDGTVSSRTRYPVHIEPADAPLGQALRARVSEGRGNADGALAIIVLGALILAGGVVLVVDGAGERSDLVGAIEEVGGAAVILTGGGVLVGGLFWSRWSERPKLVLSPVEAVRAARTERPALRLSLRPGGLVGSF